MKEEYRPSDSILNAVISIAIIPNLEKLEADLEIKLDSTLTVESNGLRGPRRLIVRSGVELPHPLGEIRIRFRKTAVEGRSLYSAESIYKRLAHKSGFSGFVADGELLEKDGAVTIKPRTWTIRYNVWDWMGWS